MNYRHHVERRVSDALDASLELIDAVRANNPDSVVTALRRADLHIMAVLLAHLADDSRSATPAVRSAAQLVGWAGPLGGSRRPTKPCGTHAAYVRHASHKETPCPPCVEAERAYQRDRKRNARRAAA